MNITATLSSRYSFTAQYIVGAKYFAAEAEKIEAKSAVDQTMQMQHRAYVTAAIMQSTATLESEVWQITRYGPGQHLGSNRTDLDAQKLLDPIKEDIDRMSVLRRFEVILHLLGKEPLDRGAKPYSDANLLMQLRNELVHNKSVSGPEMDRKKLYKNLKNLNHKKPSFVKGNVNYFPFECLSAECADWAWKTVDRFLTEFSTKLGKPSVLDGYLGRVE